MIFIKKCDKQKRNWLLFCYCGLLIREIHLCVIGYKNSKRTCPLLSRREIQSKSIIMKCGSKIYTYKEILARVWLNINNSLRRDFTLYSRYYYVFLTKEIYHERHYDNFALYNKAFTLNISPIRIYFSNKKPLGFSTCTHFCLSTDLEIFFLVVLCFVLMYAYIFFRSVIHH